MQQPHPPFVLAAAVSRRHCAWWEWNASIWNFANEPFAEFVRKSAILDEHCAAIGRDPGEIERSVQLIFDYDNLAGLRETVREFIGAGATHIVLYLRAPFPRGNRAPPRRRDRHAAAGRV